MVSPQQQEKLQVGELILESIWLLMKKKAKNMLATQWKVFDRTIWASAVFFKL